MKMVDNYKKLGVVGFNDRSQRGTMELSQVKGINYASLVFSIQRSCSVSDHKGVEEILRVAEKILTRHLIWNFNTNDNQFETKFTAILNNFDIDFPIFVQRAKTKKVRNFE